MLKNLAMPAHWFQNQTLYGTLEALPGYYTTITYLFLICNKISGTVRRCRLGVMLLTTTRGSGAHGCRLEPPRQTLRHDCRRHTDAAGPGSRPG